LALAARSAADGRTGGWGMGPPGPRERSRNIQRQRRSGAFGCRCVLCLF
jgi:hypothetical protein